MGKTESQKQIPPQIEAFLRMFASWVVEELHIVKPPRDGHGTLPVKGI